MVRLDWERAFGGLCLGGLALLGLGTLSHHVGAGFGWTRAAQVIGGLTFVLAFWCWVAASSEKSDRKRPEELRAASQMLKLAYVGDHPLEGLDAAALRMKPEPYRYLMRGTYRNLTLLVTLGRIPDTEGDDHMWCVFIRLPNELPEIGIRTIGNVTGRRRVLRCGDWPLRKGRERFQRREVPPLFAEIVERSGMREWLEELPPHHFHVSGHWVLCRGPNVGVADHRMLLKAQIEKEVAIAERFIDLLPASIFHRSSL